MCYFNIVPVGESPVQLRLAKAEGRHNKKPALSGFFVYIYFTHPPSLTQNNHKLLSSGQNIKTLAKFGGFGKILVRKEIECNMLTMIGILAVMFLILKFLNSERCRACKSKFTFTKEVSCGRGGYGYEHTILRQYQTCCLRCGEVFMWSTNTSTDDLNRIF